MFCILQQEHVMLTFFMSSCTLDFSSPLSLSLSLSFVRWAPVAHMITPRMNLGVGAIKDMRDAVTGVTFNAIYAIGGYSGKSILGTAEKYEIQTDTWSEIAPMKTPRRNVGQ